MPRVIGPIKQDINKKEKRGAIYVLQISKSLPTLLVKKFRKSPRWRKNNPQFVFHFTKSSCFPIPIEGNGLILYIFSFAMVSLKKMTHDKTGLFGGKKVSGHLSKRKRKHG